MSLAEDMEGGNSRFGSPLYEIKESNNKVGLLPLVYTLCCVCAHACAAKCLLAAGGQGCCGLVRDELVFAFYENAVVIITKDIYCCCKFTLPLSVK